MAAMYASDEHPASAPGCALSGSMVSLFRGYFSCFFDKGLLGFYMKGRMDHGTKTTVKRKEAKMCQGILRAYTLITLAAITKACCASLVYP